MTSCAIPPADTDFWSQPLELGTARRCAADLETANDAVGNALLTLSPRFEYILDPEFRLSVLEARSRSSLRLAFVRVVIRELTEKWWRSE